MRKAIYEMKEWKIIGAIAIGIAFIVCVLLYHSDVEVVSSHFLGADGNIIYLDEENVLYKLNENGTILVEKDLPEKKGNYEYSYSNLTSDSEGNIYLLVKAYDSREETTQNYVQKFSSKGKKLETVFETEVDSQKNNFDFSFCGKRAGHRCGGFRSAGIGSSPV